MSTDASPNTTEWHWIRRVAEQLEACAVRAGEIAVVLCETRSRRVTVETARLALAYLGAQVAVVEVPTPANPGPVPIRSTGASVALQGHAGAVAACAAAGIVVDCTVEGLLHSPELGTILAGGARVLMISNEHPEVFERLAHDPSLAGRVDAGLALMQAAEAMRVTSPHGTELTVNLDGALRAGSCGWTTEPGTIAHWPGGLVLCFPAAGCVAGTIVLAPGDVNLTFKEYVRTPVRLTIADDHITAVVGDGLDAELFASYLAAWGDRAAYAVSHAGWGMNPGARWDVLQLYDKGDINGTELRAFAGNFLYSTGANEVAGRFTRGHFDLPMRGCTVVLDGPAGTTTVVSAGHLAI